jgi:DNA-binding MarR family transcriptional regulator
MAEHQQRSLVPEEAAEIVSHLIYTRQKREAIFTANLFSDPAWDIMLTLFLAQLRHQSVATSDVSISTSIPLTTTHRWIDTLDQKGWIRRAPDPSDQRRIFVELTARGSSAMHAWVADWIENYPRLTDDNRVRDLLTSIDRGRRGP